MNMAMDIAPRLQEHVVFHLTGKREGAGVESVEGRGLRPALFARFGDLTKLRYDYPLVLAEPGADGEWLRTLSGVVDSALQKIAPAGIGGERLRRSVLRAERQIRSELQEGEGGTLLELWDEAAALLAARGGAEVEADLARARSALAADGQLVDCDSSTPARVVAHAWHRVQEAKAQRMRREIDALVVRLSDLVKADHMRSEGGRHAEALKAGFGGAHRALFDFRKMAELLAKPSGASALSPERRARIDAALAVLRSQRFFAHKDRHEFEFDEARDAIAAYKRRLPEMAGLVKAMTIADLEVHGRYAEAKHDALFEGFGPEALGPQDLARFPDYLVCRTADRGRKGGGGAAARALLLKVLSSGAPIKIVLESGTLLEDTLSGEGGFSLGAQLASSAMGLGEAYVMQAAASHLYRVRDRLLAAMRYPGPALVCVYSGARSAAAEAGGLPSYLLAAAAMESRVFPAFCYDPGAGADWAARFTLEGNPQPDVDWPVHEFAWADENLQRHTEKLPFTLADFAACDARFARHFARVPREQWSAAMVGVSEWLARPGNGVPETVPCVHAIDPDSRLQKLIVDEKLVHAARLCAQAWRRLQELDRLKRKEVPATKADIKEEIKPESKAKVEAKPEPVQEKREIGDPYIETERCSSCNECTNLNNRMFAYNDNKQAYIKDPDAGSFRELVEAAESCQVAVIHPGKPRNPKEAGLDDLVKRAEPFQ